MLNLNDYTATEILYEGSKSIVYRGYRNSDKQAVVIKRLQGEYPDPHQIRRLQNEFEIVRNLDSVGIIKLYALEHQANTWALIAEDIRGDSLNHVLAAQKLDIVMFLHLAVQLAQALGELHTHGIIHKDLKPANIIANLNTRQTKITDFSIAVRQSDTRQLISGAIEGTLAYMAPEQTGRVNHVIDHRTDFYSLGIVFYEMLAGKTPFQSDDTLEIIHAHIARTPTSPDKLNPDVPAVLAAIVMKLLAKAPEDRYQSSNGLRLDLENCLNQLEASGSIENFTLAQFDIPEQFKIPHKLYGQNAPLRDLLSALNDARQGERRLKMIAGPAGSGKTQLIQTLAAPVASEHGYFIQGNCAPNKKYTAYAAFAEAFGDLINQLLGESEQRLVAWRTELLDALGGNGAIIIEFVPDLELIIGPQPELPELSGTEANHRFNRVFLNFLSVFCRPGHPLVIFMDDAHWIDGATLQLSGLMLTDPNVQGLLLTGAYRTEEVQGKHPLKRALDSFAKADNSNIQIINLAPMELADIVELLVDMLHVSPRDVHLLAEIIREKTGGNPYFVRQFLSALNEQGLLTFQCEMPALENDQTKGSSGHWAWDEQEVRLVEITDNVADWLLTKFQQFPEETQQLLKVAACMGQQFELSEVSHIVKQPVSYTNQHLSPALQAGFIMAVGVSLSELNRNSSTHTGSFGTTDQSQIFTYRFPHERIRQAVYDTQQDPTSLHLAIGDLWLEST
ncbi:MAG: AAA family ATPase, partial [Pseudomonadota bacterium]